MGHLKARAGNLLTPINLAAFAFTSGWQSMIPFFSLYAYDLGANAAQVGAVASALSIGPLLLTLPVGIFTQKVEPRRIVLAGTITGAIGLVAMATAKSLAIFAASLLLYGIGLLLFSLGSQTSVVTQYRPDDWDKVIGLYFFAASIGLIIGPILGSALVVLGGYRLAFLGAAAQTGLAAGFSALVRPETGHVETLGPSGVSAKEIVAILRGRTAREGLAASLAGELVLTAWSIFYPLLLTGKGFSSLSIGFLFSLRGAASSSIRPAMRILTRKLSRASLLRGSLWLLALSLSLMPFMFSAVAVISTVVVFGVSAGLILPVSMTLVSSAFPSTRSGLSVAFRQFMTRTGQVVGPLLLGSTAQLIGLPRAMLLISTIAILPSLFGVIGRSGSSGSGGPQMDSSVGP